ncbi:MAG: CRISPR-associated helicase Cas3', partial [Nitrospirae bacterium]|nr:CRISPR-associated helicase Cas3' [Nitrospirota bacterium]
KIHDSNQYVPLLAYFVVLHHHGDLNALELDVVRAKDLKDSSFRSVEEPLRSRLKNLQIQLEDIRQNLPPIEEDFKELFCQPLQFGVTIAEFLNSSYDVLSSLHKLQYHLTENENEKTRLEVFITTIFLYSLLIDADKKDAADVGGVQRKEIPDDLVDRYREVSPKIDTKATVGIDGIRNEIYNSVVIKASEIPLSNHILTLTAPTGTGKTLSSISCALKLRERIKKESGYSPRIIYSLPFTSIIDQNYEVMRDVLSLLQDFEQNESAYLIKHHHLADLKYKIDNEDRPVSESLLLVESWESEIIVTTFIQLLHTIIGFKNSFLKKYHNIAGSIILLDEVQNIPIEYWPLVNWMFKLLVEHLECYVILLTATKPLIFNEDTKEAIPLLDNSEEYFKNKGLDRITLMPDISTLTLEGLFQKFKGLYNITKSYLIVFNTIKSSIGFYEMIKKDVMFKELFQEKNVAYLSTNIIPKERSKRIKLIKKKLKQGEKIIVISTQVVEAGVDIDLDIVIRDIGPIDSIIQAAGRCNRGMGENKGIVYVHHLVDDKNSLAKYVYGTTHFVVSHDLLGSNQIEESQFFDLINRYFTVIVQKKNQDDSTHIWNAIKDFRFRHTNPNLHSISDFGLIKEKNGYMDVFVEIDKWAKLLLDMYAKEVIKEKNLKKRQEKYLSIRKDFKSYIISIPKKLTTGLEVITEDLLKIPYYSLAIYYENDTGFKRTEDASFIF